MPAAVRRVVAFTLIELLVVLAIIGLILALSLPNIRSMSEGRVIEGATRQLMDDLAFARQQAIAHRSTVVVLFMPPSFATYDWSIYPPASQSNLFRLAAGAQATYAIFSARTVGDQPGKNTQRYLTEWRSLPEKSFISTLAFNTSPSGFHTNITFTYPDLNSSIREYMHYVAFNPLGQLTAIDQLWMPRPNSGRDVDIPIASGVVLYTRNPNGSLASWTAQEVPVGNATNNIIHIDWLTGRAQLIRPDVTKQ
jgi:prepilin-type N-terminal cleavage/methylation domain-containing protein